MAIRSPRQSLRPLGYIKYVAGTIDSAKTLDAPPGASIAVIRCETQSVRWRDDNVDPTASVGMLMLAADPPMTYYGDLTKFRMMSASAGAILHVLFYA